ncbi:MAG: hypothetical protein J6K12_06910 [Clostridia bacterium]|nr:hypothetical protein [Clostridia bacterium]
MGFGLIFMGWSTLLFLKIMPVGILGAYLMFRGLCKLSGYSEYFVKAKKASVGLLCYFVLFGIMWVLDIFGIFRFTEIKALMYADQVLYYVALLVFSYFLYKGLGDISNQTGFEKGIKREQKCVSLLIVFVIFSLVRIAGYFFGIEVYLRLPMLVYEMFWLVYSAMYIYSCYMMIATQEIIDDENKKMREYDEKYSMLKRKKK